jgi:quinoprotein glucose dehydrogenase
MHAKQFAGGVLLLGLAGTAVLRTQMNSVSGEWRYFGGDKAFTRYSPLDQINRDNVKNLKIVWRKPAVDPELVKTYRDLKVNTNFRATPVMINNVLYSPNGVGLVQALDPATGKTIWEQEPFGRTLEEVSASSMRGVDRWNDGSGADGDRLFLVRGEYLYALNGKTGKPYRDFGTQGRVSLHWNAPLSGLYSWTAGPIVIRDVVVVAGNTNGAGDSGFVKEASSEDVRGYDARHGRLLWTFHVVPKPGEFGNETWGNDSWKVAGDLGNWCCLTVDEELGYVYVALTAPTASYYGGWRPGDNLFSDSLVALDAKTGKRVWHFQMVHHDVWEYDTVGPAILGDITVDGRRIKAVIQPSKTGFLYVFDRATGTPVWPIVERPVPQSTTPGEHTSPTQPFPTKPPAFDRQGVTEDDLIDFTPQLRAQARELVKPFVLGSMFTPPSVKSDQPGGTKGTLLAPGVFGAGNWNTGAFDPETGMYYAVSHTVPTVYDLVKPLTPNATLEYGIDFQQRESNAVRRHTDIAGPEGLPILKPPYGRITAMDLNRGEIRWTVANGNGPRDHPLLKDLHLPPLGVPTRAAPLLTKTLLFLGEGSDFSARTGLEKKFRAFDKTTGAMLFEIELPSGTTGGPMTYLFNGKQYIVVAVGGRQESAEWVALALP